MYISLSLLFTVITPYMARLIRTYTTFNTNNPPCCQNFSLGTYNIHGLPRFITFDPTYERMEEITNKITAPNSSYHFDIFNIQEDWTKYGNNILVSNLAPIQSYATNIYTTADTQYTYSWSRWLNEYNHEYSIFGSGLLQLSKTVPVSYHYQIFKKHHGYDDIWANKGFQVSQYKYFDVYNTHLDAGKTKGDQKARKENVQQIIDYAKQFSKDKAIIIAGDTNLYNNTIDNATYENLIAALNLTEITKRGHIDKIFLRNSTRTTLSSPTVIVDNFQDLSDHKMSYVSLELCYY